MKKDKKVDNFQHLGFVSFFSLVIFFLKVSPVVTSAAFFLSVVLMIIGFVHFKKLSTTDQALLLIVLVTIFVVLFVLKSAPMMAV